MRHKTKKIIIVFMSVFLLILLSVTFLGSKKHTVQSENNYVSGFNKGTEIEVFYQSEKNNSSNIVRFDKKEKIPLPYMISLSEFEMFFNIKNKTDIYDIRISQNDQALTVSLKNTPLNSQISILADGHHAYQNIPVDWAGHLKLTPIPITQKTCIEIMPENQQARTICLGRDKGAIL